MKEVRDSWLSSPEAVAKYALNKRLSAALQSVSLADIFPEMTNRERVGLFAIGCNSSLTEEIVLRAEREAGSVDQTG